MLADTRPLEREDDDGDDDDTVTEAAVAASPSSPYNETLVATHAPSRGGGGDAAWIASRVQHADLVDLWGGAATAAATAAVATAATAATADEGGTLVLGAPSLPPPSPRWVMLVDGDQHINGLHHFRQHEGHWVNMKVGAGRVGGGLGCWPSCKISVLPCLLATLDWHLRS